MRYLLGGGVLVGAGGLVEYRLRRTENKIMATVQQLTAAVENLKQQQQQAGERVAADVAELRRLLVEAGAGGADLDAAIASIEEVADSLKALDPDPSFPTPNPSEPAGEQVGGSVGPGGVERSGGTTLPDPPVQGF